MKDIDPIQQRVEAVAPIATVHELHPEAAELPQEAGDDESIMVLEGIASVASLTHKRNIKVPRDPEYVDRMRRLNW